MLGFLTKQYIGYLTRRMEQTPINRYYYPIFLIGKYSGEISQQGLADMLRTDKVSMVRILDCLAEDGYIERRVNPKDRRQHLLHITEAGKPWMNEIEAAFIETDEFFFSVIDSEERVKFREQMLLLIEHTKDVPVEEVELFYNRIKDMKGD